jgi:hypothetical protein
MTGGAHEPEPGAPDLREMHAQVVWLESCGWSIDTDGRWRHPVKAADIGLTHSQAFAVEGRTLEPADADPEDPDEPVSSL